MARGGERLLLGLVRIHVLVAAELGPVWGNKILSDLRTIDHALSPGTLYPLLHGLVRDGLLASAPDGKDRRRQAFEITPEGQQTLAQARLRMESLLGGKSPPRPTPQIFSPTPATPPIEPIRRTRGRTAKPIHSASAVESSPPVHLL